MASDKKNIAIVSGYDKLQPRFHSHKNHKLYADKHGYAYYFDTDRESHEAHFSKIKKILKYIDLHDWIFWVDDDAFFTDFNIKLEDLIVVGNEKELIFCKSPPDHPEGYFTLLNSGCFFIKNTIKTKKYLMDVLSVDLTLVKNWWKKEYGIFTAGEQNSIYYLLHNGSEYDDDAFFEILESKHFNSRPYQFQNSYNEYFICHFAGGEKERQIEEFAKKYSLNKTLMPKPVLVHFIHRISSNETGNKNTGEMSCCPLDHFDEFKEVDVVYHDMYLILYDEISKHDIVIIGGGGLFDCLDLWNENINKLFDCCDTVIAWGVGFNTHTDAEIKTRIEFDKFKLVSTRDYNHPSRLRYIPCVSLMSPLLDSQAVLQRRIGIIDHQDFPVDAAIEGERISNTETPEIVIGFIASSEIIVSSSYHCVLWSILMGKKTICSNPFSTKFNYLPSPPVFYSGDLEADILRAESELRERDAGALLLLARQLNRDFFKEVWQFIPRKPKGPQMQTKAAIPKIIHYCWLSNDPIPDKLRSCMESWREHLAGYEFILWNFDKFDITKSEWVRGAFEAKKYACAADYIRLYAVYNFGGIYLDMDVEVLKPFDDLLGADIMIAVEDAQRGDIEAGCFGAVKGHPFIKKCLEYHYKPFINPLVLPRIMRTIKNTYFKNKEYHIKTSDYFTAKSFFTGKITTTQNTYAIHHYAGSWLNDEQKKVITERWDVYVKCKNIDFAFELYHETLWLNNENLRLNNEISNLYNENLRLNNEISNLYNENLRLNNEISNLYNDNLHLKQECYRNNPNNISLKHLYKIAVKRTAKKLLGKRIASFMGSVIRSCKKKRHLEGIK